MVGPLLGVGVRALVGAGERRAIPGRRAGVADALPAAAAPLVVAVGATPDPGAGDGAPARIGVPRRTVGLLRASGDPPLVVGLGFGCVGVEAGDSSAGDEAVTGRVLLAGVEATFVGVAGRMLGAGEVRVAVGEPVRAPGTVRAGELVALRFGDGAGDATAPPARTLVAVGDVGLALAFEDDAETEVRRKVVVLAISALLGLRSCIIASRRKQRSTWL